jgi:hypothetical protein
VKKTTDKPQSSTRDYVIFTLILLAVVLIWCGAWWWIDTYVPAVPASDTTAATRGQFGDKFGAVNALFSGMAFAGIIFTILLQRSDLIETRKAISHERFDTTLFELLGLHMKITEAVETIGGRGKDAFVTFHEVLKGKDPDFYAFSTLSKLGRDQIRQIIDTRVVDRGAFPALTDADVNNIQAALEKGVRALENFLDPDLNMHETKIVAAYKAAAESNIDDFAHYFRNLYNILKFIDQSDQIFEKEKKRYSRFVRSQLSEAELIVLFYNSIAEIKLPGRELLELGYPKMSALLVKYDILQNMNPRSMIHPLHRAIFDKNTPKEKK